jgi:hypothetical protein
MDDLYDKVKEDVALRKSGPSSVDSASNCPQLYQMYRKQGQNLKRQKRCKSFKLLEK